MDFACAGWLLMCGIVGLFLKNVALEPELGRLTAAMVRELRDRGPDSAGFAVYGDETSGITKICAIVRAGERCAKCLLPTQSRGARRFREWVAQRADVCCQGHL